MKNLMKKSKKGFTLMEMLIVVAIIAILVVIAIPTFTNALNEARANTDLANTRAWYAEQMANAMTNNNKVTCTTAVYDKDNAAPWGALQYSGSTVTVTVGNDKDITSFKVTFASDKTGDAIEFSGAYTD